jgi:NADPH2:quinone reductase
VEGRLGHEFVTGVPLRGFRLGDTPPIADHSRTPVDPDTDTVAKLQTNLGEGSVGDTGGMRALQVHDLTGPEGVGVADAPEPTAADGLVLVDVRAAGVSFVDVLLSRGEYQVKLDPPFTLGIQFAGVDSAGRRVAGVSFGAFAELVAVPDFALLELPDAVSFEQGAVLGANYQSAHFALVRRGRVAPGETVLVHGAGGGVGSAAVQVAKAVGARVIAVASDERKRQIALDAGADEVVESNDDWRQRVKTLTDGGGVQLVLDPVGGSRLEESLRSLAPEGRLLVVGFASGEIPKLEANRVLLRNADVVGVNWGGIAVTRPDIIAAASKDLTRWLAEGQIDPVVGQRYHLEDGAQALRAIEQRTAAGNLVLTLA